MGKGGRSKFNTLFHARSKLTDDDIPNLWLGQESTDYEEVDISQNQLTSRGLKAVVKFCCRCANLRIFKAYKNEIDDAGAYHLAKLLERCAYLEELHLSHNCLTAKGVRVIVQAADLNRHRSMSPLWLRLEQNHVAHATDLLGHLANEYSVCGRMDERSCTSRHCAWKRKVHVPFLYMQREEWKEPATKYWHHQETYESYESYEDWDEEDWPEADWKAHSAQASDAASYAQVAKWRPSLERFESNSGQFIDPVQELFQKAKEEEKISDWRWEPVDRKKAASEAAEDDPVAAPAEEPKEPPLDGEQAPEDEGLLQKLVEELKVTELVKATTSAKRWAAKPEEAAAPAPVEEAAPAEEEAPAKEASVPEAPAPEPLPEAVAEDVKKPPEVPEAEAEPRTARKTRRAKKKKNKISEVESPEEGRSRSDSLDTVSTREGTLLSCDASESAASSAGSSLSLPKRDPDEAVDPTGAEGVAEGWGPLHGIDQRLMKLLPFAEIPNQEEMTARLERALEASQLMVSSEDKQKVKDCLAGLEATIKEDLEPEQQWTVEIFGSMRTGFGTKGCDLDVVIVRANAQDRESNVQAILMKLREQLEATPNVKIKNTILSARVPILKLEYSGRDVDISVNNTKALMNSRLLAAYADLDPLIPQFGVAVKLWAKDAELCGAPNGHLSSYAFILMALYFLQVASGDELPCLQDGLTDSDLEDDEKVQKRVDEIKASGWKMQTGDLWMLLAGFFAFYGGSLGPTYQYEPFHWGREVISIRLGKRSRGLPLDHELLAELKGRSEGHIHIEDPVDHGRNLRDVLWLHPTNHEKQLREEISWMDQLCRDQVRQQILNCGWPQMPPPIAAFPGTSGMFDFPAAFSLAQAIPWSSGFLGPSSKGKAARFRGGKFGRQVRRVN